MSTRTHPDYGVVEVDDAAVCAGLREAAVELSTLRSILLSQFPNTTPAGRIARLERLATELKARAAFLDPRGFCEECGGPHETTAHDDMTASYLQSARSIA